MTEPDAPSRPLLIIHAGMGKAGSSAIQKYLREQAGTLAEAGAIYFGMQLDQPATPPPAFASPTAFRAALAEGRRDDKSFIAKVLPALRERIASFTDTKTLIWSQIGLTNAAALMAPVIEGVADVCDVRVILYFRHQAAWLRSAYAQWGIRYRTHAGAVRSFDEFRPLVAANLDYARIIAHWRRAVGADRLAIRSYDACDDVVADFLATAGLPAPAAEVATRHYETPDPAILTLLKLVQGQHDDPEGATSLTRLLASAAVDTRNYRAVDPADTRPTGDVWDALIASFATENDRLSRDYGLTLSAPAPRPDEPSPASAPATLVPILIDLITALDQRVAVLERRLAAAAKPASGE